MKRIVVFAALLALLSLWSAPASAQLIGLPNPASTFCVETGGTLVIGNTGAGEVGNCVYDSGLAVDEWALYRFFSSLTDPLAW
jgi:putative hemolysin